MNASVFKQCGSQAEVFGQILLLCANSASGYDYNCGHFSGTNMNIAISSRTVERIKFMNWDISVICSLI